MKTLKVILKRIGVCLLFALVASIIFLDVANRICGTERIENSAGGGAAIGIIALYVAYYAWPLSFVGLTLIDLARYFLPSNGGYH